MNTSNLQQRSARCTWIWLKLLTNSEAVRSCNGNKSSRPHQQHVARCQFNRGKTIGPFKNTFLLSQLTHCLAKTKTNWSVRNFGLPPRCKWDLGSSELLHSVEWKLVTDVLGHPIGLIFKSQAKTWPLKMGPIGSPEMSVNQLPFYAAKLPRTGRTQLVRACTVPRCFFWHAKHANILTITNASS
jgi:hypothetical protein